jgi:pilus assembly protein Flp/PilA
VLESDVNTLLSLAIELRDDRSGATAIEYSLLAALIALVIIGAVTSLGQTLDTLYPRIESYLAGTASTP